MPKRWMMLICISLLGPAGPSEANPLDSPDIVYIDGLPCNSLCQSYMAWSRAALSKSTQSTPAQPARRSTNAVAHRATGLPGESPKPATRTRKAKQATPNLDKIPEAKSEDLQPAGNAAAVSDTARPNIAGAPAKADIATNPNPRTIQEQVAAATAVAELVTVATAVPASEQKPNTTDRSGRAEAMLSSDAASASPKNAHLLVALLMARPEIKALSDLTNKNIAMDERHAAFSGNVQSAIAAAGAAEVQLGEGQTTAIDRLISGEVPAAVLSLVSAEAAEAFPEIAGFKIFRIPLSPRSLEARLEPAGNAAANSDLTRAKIADSHPTGGAAVNSNTRTIQEQVTAATSVADRVTAGAVLAPEQTASNSDRSNRSEPPVDAEKPPIASLNDINHLVALLMARPDIKSVSDLAGKDIAIDDKQSASNANVRTAIVAAGAAEVRLREGQTKAIDRLISGEVPAAVLSLVSAEAAEAFPEIAGFKIFRIPLSPRSLKERL
jgi:hypothetical protein